MNILSDPLNMSESFYAEPFDPALYNFDTTDCIGTRNMRCDNTRTS